MSVNSIDLKSIVYDYLDVLLTVSTTNSMCTQIWEVEKTSILLYFSTFY